MSDNRAEFERELVVRLNDAAAGPAPRALERAMGTIAATPQPTGWHVWFTSGLGGVQWTQAGAIAAVAAAALVVGMAIGRYGLAVGDGPSSTPSPSATPSPSILEVWRGPVRSDAVDLPVVSPVDPIGGPPSWTDPRDATLGGVDITGLLVTNPEDQIGWSINLAERPPPAARLDPAETVISYGLVIDRSGDGTPDLLVGINNDAPKPGDFRVWVTDLATGHTDEQVGPPYGYPIEFAHPDEQTPGDDRPPRMYFTFLQSPGSDAASRFYAWTSVTNGDEVVAWDYAPDVGWLTASPSAER